MDKKLKIEFAPGCFDSFEGTQEELDQLIKEITEMIDSGEFFEKAVPFEEGEDPELDAAIERSFNTSTRIVQ